MPTALAPASRVAVDGEIQFKKNVVARLVFSVRCGNRGAIDHYCLAVGIRSHGNGGRLDAHGCKGIKKRCAWTGNAVQRQIRIVGNGKGCTGNTIRVIANGKRQHNRTVRRT